MHLHRYGIKPSVSASVGELRFILRRSNKITAFSADFFTAGGINKKVSPVFPVKAPLSERAVKT